MSFLEDLFNWSKDNIYSKIRSPLWWSFLLAWSTWNWKVIYVTFFISEDITKDKIIYISNLYNYFSTLGLEVIIVPLWFLINWLIIPFILTYIIIFKISNIDKIFYRKQKEIEREKIKIKQEMERQFIEKEKEITKEKEKIINKKEKIEEKEEKLEKKEINEWDIEYDKIIKSNPNIMKELSFLIYDNNWYTNSYNIWWMNKSWYRESQNTKLFHALELINLNKDKDWHFLLTSKWKAFLKKDSLEN